VGPTCQLGAERRGCFPAMEAETERGAGAARGPAGLGDEGGSPGRIGPAQRAGLIPQERWKNKKSFDFQI
jgi:hypothetical protein